MNKQKFIDLLRKPHTATDDSVTELESVIEQFPYFQTAHIVLARGSKNVKHPKTTRRISSAAVYSTDRVLLKKYINDHIIFLDITKEEDKAREAAITAEDEKLKKEVLKPQESKSGNQSKPKQEEQIKEVQKASPTQKGKPSPKPNSDTGIAKKETKPTAPTQKKETPPQQGRNKIPPLNLQKSDFDADSIIDEMKIELEEYKKNKKQFDDWVQNEEERTAVEAALKKVSDQEKPIELEVPVEETTAVVPDNQDIEVSTTPEETEEEPISLSEPSSIKPPIEIEPDKSIPSIEDVKPVEFKTAAIPKPKTSGYSSKILIEGSNKNVKAEEPKEEPKRRERSSKRVVQKVKKAPQPAKPEHPASEEVKPTEPTQEVTSKLEDTTKEEPKATSNNVLDASAADTGTTEPPTKENIEEEVSTSIVPSEEIQNEDQVEETVNEGVTESEAFEEEIKTEILEDSEEPLVGKEDVTEVLEEKETQASDDSTSVEPSTSEIDDIPAPDDDDSTPDDEESFDLEVNDETGHISREDDKFDIKKDKKRAGQLRKEKMRKLREQRGIIDEFIETDPQMPAPDKKKVTEEPETKTENKEEATKDLAEKSMKPDEEIISENLAIIYKNQGKITKTIEIYEKLILKFPKKEAYFAARIEELKKS